MVFLAAKNGQLPIFEDSLCQTPSSFFKNYPRRDTVISFDPTTYEEQHQEVFTEINPSRELVAWRLRQVLVYHRKSGTWSTIVESIAPLTTILDNEGNTLGIQPLFWFRPDNERQNLNSKHIIWAKRTENLQGPTQVHFPYQPILKASPGYENPFADQFRLLGNHMKTPFYDSYNMQPLSPKERLALLSVTDTIVTFDPETYEEKIVIVSNERDADNVSSLRLVQSWYWDERRHRLSICLDAVAPWLEMEDFHGDYRYGYYHILPAKQALKVERYILTSGRVSISERLDCWSCATCIRAAPRCHLLRTSADVTSTLDKKFRVRSTSPRTRKSYQRKKTAYLLTITRCTSAPPLHCKCRNNTPDSWAVRCISW